MRGQDIAAGQGAIDGEPLLLARVNAGNMADQPGGLDPAPAATHTHTHHHEPTTANMCRRPATAHLTTAQINLNSRPAQMMDTSGSTISSVSAVTEFEGKLFLGNLQGNFVSVLQVDGRGDLDE